ncbi:hypothetical protein F8388_020458 [Cannabis sativa]|uniref:Uncharacterized protein n=1 Tax=Cannabis sativa TaxID=3483 RepID=A0A7J6E0G3_CANSA|nr:hypothetical protein F8388_020458 [Cannabis sativa]
MDLELVNRLAELLVLDEGNGPVLSLNKADIEEEKKRMDLCLVGKVIGRRPTNKDELFAREWGERIGKLEDIKIVNGTMKVRVQINITEPLKRGLRVAVDDHGNEALDCPLRDFAGDNPNFDRGRYGLWMCAPGSPPRDRPWFQKKRENSPSNRPIMTMGEALRIVSAIERNRVRYSGLTPEELAPTSVLEAPERDEELVSSANVDQNATVALGVQLSMAGSESRVQKVGIMEMEKVMSKSSSSLGSLADVGTVLPDDDNGKQVAGGECSMGVDNASTSVNVDMSGEDELSFRHAVQQTFEPLIKVQKSKTWKRLNSSIGRGSKGVSKPSSFPISPKLSHVMVANAKYKLSPKVGGGGKWKMDMEVATESVG